jgi:hypothetical protein
MLFGGVRGWISAAPGWIGMARAGMNSGPGWILQGEEVLARAFVAEDAAAGIGIEEDEAGIQNDEIRN